MISEKDLIDDLRALGIGEGDILNVHSSMKKIGGRDVEGGPEAVIRALLATLGAEGTLVMPVFTELTEFVDLNVAPSRLGLITETFRTWPGVLRSNDPTHSVGAIGKHAETIISGHEDLAPLDVDSPLHRVAKMGGKILHLGCNIQSCSMLHVAESIADLPYQVIGYGEFDRDMPYRGTDGIDRVQTFMNKAPGDGAGFIKAMDWPEMQTCCVKGKTGAGESYLFDAAKLMDVVVTRLRQDPHAILCDNERCSVCPARKQIAITN